MNKLCFHHLSIAVDDLERARQFYADVLEMQGLHRPVGDGQIKDLALFGRRTFLTECSSLVVIQYHSNIDVQNAVPIQYPVGHGFSIVRLADGYTPPSEEVMPSAN
jgi:catechol 2,3-dioxygenase-like lactoylglutathione lyase family enzyme